LLAKILIFLLEKLKTSINKETQAKVKVKSLFLSYTQKLLSLLGKNTATNSKGAFTLGVRDFSVESPNTILVI
jgi:hypothetical protein